MGNDVVVDVAQRERSNIKYYASAFSIIQITLLHNSLEKIDTAPYSSITFKENKT